MGTTEHDDRWDALALGHVLGGLAEDDASSFRRHLTGCRHCRSRVAELRALADDLAEADREERAVQRLRTRTRAATADDEGDADGPGGATPAWRTILLVGALVLVVAGLATWNAVLRNENRELTRTVGAQESTLSVLGLGTTVPVQAATGVSGVVTVDGNRVGWSLAGLPQPAAGERLVVWIEHGDDEMTAVAQRTPSQLERRRDAASVGLPGARRLVITLEPVAVPPAPTGTPILQAELVADGGP